MCLPMGLRLFEIFNGCKLMRCLICEPIFHRHRRDDTNGLRAPISKRRRTVDVRMIPSDSVAKPFRRGNDNKSSRTFLVWDSTEGGYGGASIGPQNLVALFPASPDSPSGAVHRRPISPAGPVREI